LIGKYVPIILGGVLARVGANASRTSAANVIGATILEQCGALASGGVVAVAFLAGWASPIAGAAVALAAIAAAAVAPSVAIPAIALMHWLRARIRRSDDFRIASIERAPVRIAWLAQLFAWAALSAFVALIVCGLHPELEPSQVVFLVGAYLLAVMLGVAAFMLPGGIGAREAAFVWMAGGIVGYDNALVMATALRIAMTGIDLVAGAGCLLYGMTRGSRQPHRKRAGLDHDR
ncbi:MAG: lysylphosphatidylglycerol synthase domain-containing protein, partial [Rhodanobacteraceae bacterium]